MLIIFIVRMKKKIILHIDLDAFFASCEEMRNPNLIGKPVIIGSDPKNGSGRGVVSTCNYRAREFGVKSAMPISWAFRRCPDGIFLPVDFKLYNESSRKVMGIINGYCDVFQQASIDEAYLDLTETVGGFDEAYVIARQLQDDIKKKVGISCSVGIGPNKLIAKIASDHKKPAGITVVINEDVISFLSGLNVRKIPGIGNVTSSKLESLGIKLVSELRECELGYLQRKFGKNSGLFLYNVSRGISNSKVGNKDGQKSIGKEKTFLIDEIDKEMILSEVEKLCEVVYKKSKKQGLRFKIITIKIRFSDFETHTKQKKYKSSIENLDQLMGIAKALILPFLRLDREIRLIGVSIGGFS